jgi:hypothetical protein
VYLEVREHHLEPGDLPLVAHVRDEGSLDLARLVSQVLDPSTRDHDTLPRRPRRAYVCQIRRGLAESRR